mgnify:CR=1 FL=1
MQAISSGMSMKYWLANIHEQNGEFEYKTIIRFKAKTYEDADKLHTHHVGTWYGEDNMRWDEDDGCFYNDYIAISEGALTEIDEHTFNALGMHPWLPDMSRT